MRERSQSLLFVCIILFASNGYSQNPNFTLNVNKGCAPLNVTFTNTSTGFSSAASYTVSYGDGKISTTFPTISHTYTTGDTYTATLTVTDNGVPYTTTKQIIVYKTPVVNFTADVQKVCAKQGVTFTANATAGDGTIAKYFWDFGDGTTLDTLANEAIHSYASTRNATVGLTVSNSFGCDNYAVKSNIIAVLSTPKASFTPDHATLCSENDKVTFTNTTTGGTSPVSYEWNFDDGTTSTDVTPTHNYGVKGRFGVRLTATGSEGCADTSRRTLITVASFRSNIVLPTLLCLNSKPTFRDTSNPVSTNPVWLLDDQIAVKDVHQYTTVFNDTNTHKLQLINTYGKCTDTVTKIVQAHAAPQPQPFSVNTTGYCAVPANVTLTDAGSGSNQWEWDLNNTDSTRFNPTEFTKSTTYTYKAENTYYVKLRVTDASGCSGEIRQPVTIKKNKITVSSSEGIYGCNSLSTMFTASSTAPVTRKRWTFSDDNSSTVLDTVDHTFLTKGLYTASVTLRTAYGCIDTASLKIRIADAPSNYDFKASDTLICGNKSITFTVTGDTDKTVGKYYWNFGDAGKYVLLTGPTYSHQYLADSVYTVSLVINNHGCIDTLTKQKYITVLPSFPKISSVVNDCSDRLKIVFKETSIKAQTFSWDFGDGSTHKYDNANREAAVVHYFPKTSRYKIILTTTNGTCISKDSINAHTLQNQKPVLTAQQSMLCENDSLLTTISGMEPSPFGYYSTIKDYSVKAIEYLDSSLYTGTYSYPDLQWKNPFHVNIKGLNPGNREVRIITISRNFNCLDTTNYVPVQVIGPVAGFSIGDTILCLANQATFTDVSKASGSTPIKNWQWFFGDSTNQTLTSGGSTTHKYDDPGNYNVKLVVTDNQNCTDTAYYANNKLTIKGPKAKFSIGENPILPDTPELFTNLTDSGSTDRSNNSYNWLFGDGGSSASNNDTLSHIYKSYGDDTVSLIAQSSQTGCSDTATSIVHVKNTKLSFTYAVSFINQTNSCPPALAKFGNTSVNFNSVSWNFGDGFTADDINNPSHTYYKPGVYKVTIYGYYADNKYDSSWDYITIGGPTATLHANVVTGCGSTEVIFTTQTQNATSLVWNFGDGSFSEDSVVTHLYKKPNFYTPSVTVKSGLQCSFSYDLETPVVIDSLEVKIKNDSILQCHQLLEKFEPKTYSLAKNNGDKINYTWSFGNGTDSVKQDTTSFVYTTPGTYNVTLVAASPYGCRDTASVQVTYNKSSAATIQGPADFCENAQASFQAVKSNPADVLSYYWQLENNTSTLQNTPAQTFTAGNHSIVLMVDDNGCKDTVYHQATVHLQPKIALSVSDSIVCLGSAVTFSATSLNNNQDVLNYHWNLGTGNSRDTSALQYFPFRYLNNGRYPVTLTATSTYGCAEQLKDTINVMVSPAVSIKAPSDICIGSSVAFAGSSAFSATKYVWHFADNSTDTAQNPAPKIYNKSAVNHTYLVGTIGNCYDTAYHTVTVHDFPEVNLSPKNAGLCFGDSLQLTAHNGIIYQWLNANDISSTTAAAPYVFPKMNTKYTVIVTDNYGCKNTDSITVLVRIPQELKVTSPVNVCAGSRANLSASGTDNYNWIDGNNLNSTTIATPVTLDSAQSKIYTVIGSDKYGCFTDTAKVEVIVKSKPDVDAGNNQIIAAGVPVQLSATSTGNMVSWNWQPPVYLSCANCATPVSKLRQSTRYTVQATDQFGCKNTDTVLVTLVCTGSRLSVPEAFTPNGDGLNDRMHISAYGIKTITHLVIYARNGNKLWERNNVSPLDNNAAWDGMCDNLPMPTGTYIYSIQATCDAGEVYSTKGTVSLIR